MIKLLMQATVIVAILEELYKTGEGWYYGRCEDPYFVNEEAGKYLVTLNEGTEALAGRADINFDEATDKLWEKYHFDMQKLLDLSHQYKSYEATRVDLAYDETVASRNYQGQYANPLRNLPAALASTSE